MPFVILWLWKSTWYNLMCQVYHLNRVITGNNTFKWNTRESHVRCLTKDTGTRLVTDDAYIASIAIRIMSDTNEGREQARERKQKTRYKIQVDCNSSSNILKYRY